MIRVAAIFLFAIFTGMTVFAKDFPATVKDVRLEDESLKEPLLEMKFQLSEGGAKIVRINKATYVIAIGMTDNRGSTPRERLRQMKVSRAKALKELQKLIEKAQVSTTESSSETTTITRKDGKETVESEETFSDEYKESIKSLMKLPPVIGRWKSADGDFVYTAIGKRIK